jgi:hypothetical protein
VSCDKRRAMRRILARLAHHRVAAPGCALSSTELVREGWPGEHMLASAGRNRLKVSLTSLRKMGLRDIIVFDGGGYLLRTNVPLHIVGENAGGEAA